MLTHSGLAVLETDFLDRKIRPELVDAAHVVAVRQTEPFVEAMVGRREQWVGAKVPSAGRSIQFAVTPCLTADTVVVAESQYCYNKTKTNSLSDHGRVISCFLQMRRDSDLANRQSTTGRR